MIMKYYILCAFLATHTNFGVIIAAPFLASSMPFPSNSCDTSGVLSTFCANSFQVLT